MVKEMFGDKVRIKSDRRVGFGYYVEVKDGDGWWPKHFRFTLWGARRLASYYQHKRLLLGMTLIDCE